MQLSPSTHCPWEITGGREAELRVGEQRVRLADIHRVSRTANEERDFLANLLNYSAYLTVAAAFLVLVVQAGWRERFLLSTLFFAIVGCTSLIDIGRANRIRLYRIRIITADKQAIDFVSAKAEEVDALFAALRRAGKA